MIIDYVTRDERHDAFRNVDSSRIAGCRLSRAEILVSSFCSRVRPFFHGNDGGWLIPSVCKYFDLIPRGTDRIGTSFFRIYVENGYYAFVLLYGCYTAVFSSTEKRQILLS